MLRQAIDLKIVRLDGAWRRGCFARRFAQGSPSGAQAVPSNSAAGLTYVCCLDAMMQTWIRRCCAMSG